MADYARPGGQARFLRNQAEQVRRIRTRRPLNWAAKTFTIQVYGEIEVGMIILPTKVMIDETEDMPEHKQIVAVDGTLLSGTVTFNWVAQSLGTFHTGHVVTGDGPDNFVMLDEPFLIENSDRFGEWIGIEVTAATFASDLAASFTVQAVPI